MITDTILNIIFDLFEFLFSSLPVMQIEIGLDVLDVFLNIIGTCLYFFPWVEVSPIVGIIALLMIWRVLVTVVRTIWSVLPFT